MRSSIATRALRESTFPRWAFQASTREPIGVFRSRTTESGSNPNSRRKSLAYSNGFIETRNMPGQALDWQFANGWWEVMADESGSNPNPEKGQPFFSPSRSQPSESGPRPLILLLAEDNLPDALLVREAIRKENLPLEVYMAEDGKQAVDFIARSEWDPEAPVPSILVLDLN